MNKYALILRVDRSYYYMLGIYQEENDIKKLLKIMSDRLKEMGIPLDEKGYLPILKYLINTCDITSISIGYGNGTVVDVMKTEIIVDKEN